MIYTLWSVTSCHLSLPSLPTAPSSRLFITGGVKTVEPENSDGEGEREDYGEEAPGQLDVRVP